MDPFLGEIRLFAGIFAPQGWNFCDGTLLPISNNDALYALIGNTYGGDGQSTFALPDLRSRVPLHQGQDTLGNTYSIGSTGGSESVTLTSAQIPAHGHTFNVQTIKGTSDDPTGNFLCTPADPNCLLFRSTTANVALAGGTVGPSGGGSPHENRQPFVAINFIIALEGIFPPQS
jgi:microcystin-dependent protein